MTWNVTRNGVSTTSLGNLCQCPTGPSLSCAEKCRAGHRDAEHRGKLEVKIRAQASCILGERNLNDLYTETGFIQPFRNTSYDLMGLWASRANSSANWGPYLYRKIDIMFIRGETGRMGGLTLENAVCSADLWTMKGFRTSFEQKN